MKRLFLLILSCVLIPCAIFAKSNAKETYPEYNIEGAGTATTGNYLVKVTVISKDKKISDDKIKIAAVHGVLFRGFTNPQKRQSQKPLAGSISNEAQHHDFYSTFLSDNGEGRNFANVVEGSRSLKKVDKFYHTSAVVSVSKEQLQKYLEQAGVIRGLNSGF